MGGDVEVVVVVALGLEGMLPGRFWACERPQGDWGGDWRGRKADWEAGWVEEGLVSLRSEALSGVVGVRVILMGAKPSPIAEAPPGMS